METEIIEKIREHYEHAKSKHPYFCYELLLSFASLEKEIEKNLENARFDIEEAERLGCLIPQMLLNCKVWKINEAIVSDNMTAAIEECYDAIAVLLRVVDVLEGRQALGNPEKDGARVWCVKRPLHKCVDCEMCPPAEIEEIIAAHRETVAEGGAK